MSYIDTIKNENVCYLDFGDDIFDARDQNAKGSKLIPVYGLLEESNSKHDFISEVGELTIGGGGGECAALVINVYYTLAEMGVISDEEYEELCNNGTFPEKDFEEHRNMIHWDQDLVFSMSDDLKYWGFEPDKHSSIRWFMSINLVVFLYHKFRFKIDYLPDYKFDLPEDEALQGKMFSHYTESKIEPGKAKEWYSGFNTSKEYFISTQDMREDKLDELNVPKH